MAKSKYELGMALSGELTGVLDLDENGNRIVIVEGREVDLDSFIDKMMGGEIQIKACKEIQEDEDEEIEE